MAKCGEQKRSKKSRGFALMRFFVGLNKLASFLLCFFWLVLKGRKSWMRKLDLVGSSGKKSNNLKVGSVGIVLDIWFDDVKLKAKEWSLSLG